MIIPAKSALLKGIFPFPVEATADALSLSVGIIPMYPLRTFIWLRCWQTDGHLMRLFQATHHRLSATSHLNIVSVWSSMQSSSDTEVFIRRSMLLTRDPMPGILGVHVRSDLVPLSLGLVLK